MQLTRELIIKKINENDTNFFYNLYNGEFDGKYDRNLVTKEVKVVYDQNYGDGNEWNIAFEFVNLNMFALLEGAYSSWDSPEWDSVSHAEPFQYTETRFREATLAYLRDQKIEEVLKKD